MPDPSVKDRETRSMINVSGFPQLWCGDCIARLGYQISEFLFPLVAVVKLHSSGFEAGMISGSQFVPVVVLSLTAGALADRADTRGLVLISSAVRGAALAVMGLVYALWGLTLWVVLIAAVVVGSATVYYDVGFQSAIPRLLRPSELGRGNGLLQASTSATQMIGPALAGLLLQTAGLPLATGVTAAAFLGATIAFGLLKAARPQPADDGTTARRHSILTGLRFTWGCRPVRDLCVQSGMFNLHEQAFLTAFLLFGVRTARLGSGAVGVLIGLASAGALIGSVVSGWFSARLHTGATVTAGLITASAAFMLGPLLITLLPAELVFGSAFLINGIALGAYNVCAVSLRQAIPPPEFIGSVTASYRMVSLGLIPVGGLLGGFLVDAIGPRAALLAIAISMTLTAMLLLASPLKHIRKIDQAGFVAA